MNIPRTTAFLLVVVFIGSLALGWPQWVTLTVAAFGLTATGMWARDDILRHRASR